jgi:hypothetical protein
MKGAIICIRKLVLDICLCFYTPRILFQIALHYELKIKIITHNIHYFLYVHHFDYFKIKDIKLKLYEDLLRIIMNIIDTNKKRKIYDCFK